MREIGYFHFRNFDPYTNTIDNHGGATVAYMEVPNGFEYAVARCSYGDNFNKYLGRTKSSGRLNSPKYRRTFVGDFDSFRNHLSKDYTRQWLE